MDESVLGGAVQELNKLTLITDMEFGRFAEALQQGLAASLAGRPRTVEQASDFPKSCFHSHPGGAVHARLVYRPPGPRRDPVYFVAETSGKAHSPRAWRRRRNSSAPAHTSRRGQRRRGDVRRRP